ncbi:MAG TPA: type II secretion system F family protein [Bryobacteraceae bacterium]|nr:type II secretion system F family protein [Bryobacteraceae bacterium]
MNEIWLGAAFFAFVLTAVLAAGYFFLRTAEQRRAPSPVALSPRELDGTRSALADLFQRIGENFPAAKNEKNPQRVKLAAAGYRWREALPIFYGIKCGSSLFFAGLLGMAALFDKGDPSLTPLPMLCGLAIGFMVPDRILASRGRARARRLRAAIPPALDLIVLAMEAGQSLDQSIADSSRSLKRTHPDLSAELAQLYLELRASSSRAESFRALGARNKEPELRKLANLLVDSDRYGVSIGPALRSHSKYLRTRFRQQAQEKARKVGVKLIFPVFFLIFPSVLLVTLGPACMMMYQQLQNLMQ